MRSGIYKCRSLKNFCNCLTHICFIYLFSGITDCKYDYGHTDLEEEIYSVEIPFSIHDYTWNLNLHYYLRKRCCKYSFQTVDMLFIFYSPQFQICTMFWHPFNIFLFESWSAPQNINFTAQVHLICWVRYSIFSFTMSSL